MIPFLALGGLIFREAEKGGGSGGGESEFPKTLPEPTGETHEAKLLNATSIIGDLFKRGAKAVSDLAAKTKDYLELEGTSSQLKTDLQSEKEAHVKTQGLFDAEKTNHGTTSGKLVKSEQRVLHLEGLCKLKGLDPDQVIVAAPEAKATSGDGLYAEYENLRKEEFAGKVAPGTAMSFYREHKTELRKYAQSQRQSQ